MLARLGKTYLAIIVNHLELFSTAFAAKFIFKILPNYAFKNNSSKIGFWIIIDFGHKSNVAED